MFLIAGWMHGATAAPVAGTAEEIVSRLQHAIDRASEQGNYSHMQALRLELAQHYTDTREYGLAARQYELLLASRPARHERVRYFVELGKMREAINDYGGAISSYQDALHDAPKDWDANLLLAGAYARTELNTQSIEVYKRCILLKPLSQEAYQGIAEVYQRQGFLNKAIANYQKALSLEATPETYLAMADCYVRMGDVTSATHMLQRAKTVLPRADYDVRLGEIYHRAGDLQRSCKAWEDALKADAQRNDVRLQLALVYDRLDRRSESDHLFKQLLETYPDSPLVHFLRAWVLYSRGDSQGSRREALVVQRLVPTEVVRHYNDKLLEELQKHS
jgi:tetratricopeptide (TPR) repeat protein